MKMEHKTKMGLMVSLGVALAAVGVWYYVTHTKRYYASTIVRLGGSSSFVFLMTLEQAYLKAWCTAIVKAKQTFSYKGKDYNTQGGMLVGTT